MSLKFRTRKLVKPEDLNARNTLFGGRLMSWIDEECAIYCACQMQTPLIVTKYISEMNFLTPAFQGDVIEIGVDTIAIGRSSLTVQAPRSRSSALISASRPLNLRKASAGSIALRGANRYFTRRSATSGS